MAILLFLNAWLVTRLWFTFRDHPLPLKEWVVLGLIQALLLAVLLAPGFHSIALLAAMVAALVVSEHLTPPERLNEGRLAGAVLVGLVSLASVHYGSPTTWVASEAELHRLEPLLLGFLGFLLVANETNLAIRALFHRLRMEPTTVSDDDAGTLDESEYNAGRVIGILERWLIYLVVVSTQNYNVIALILAAKGFARFRQLDRRQFAEYVLIGTLASLLFTVIIGESIVYFLG
ncbi:MAG: hypothetical protein ACLFVH_14650 [Phycisphaerae bacterium]